MAGLLIRGEEQGTDYSLTSIERIIRAYEPAREVKTRLETDHHGYQWAIIRHDLFDGLTEGVALISDAFLKQEYTERIVAAIFPFTWKEKKLYLIFLQRTGKFSPFVPISKKDDLRDLPMEARIEGALRNFINTERDMSKWYPMWEMPI